eukprot:3291200-Alexandrium_andersonii.AAC.1
MPQDGVTAQRWTWSAKRRGPSGRTSSAGRRRRARGRERAGTPRRSSGRCGPGRRSRTAKHAAESNERETETGRNRKR